jgi:hypothetical protein
VDIISFSNVFQDDPDLSAAIEKCVRNGKFVVSAIGNARDFIGRPDGPDVDTFPACYQDVIAVGSFDASGHLCSFSNWNPRLRFLAPGDFSVKTAGLNGSAEDGKGTSIATAFTAGCLALLFSHARINRLTKQHCVDSIQTTCDDIGSSIGRDIQSGFGRMNLRNAITKL